MSDPGGAGRRLRVGLLTNEYPPEIYGGAGVHVDELARTLAAHVELEVHCFGQDRDDPLVAHAHRPWDALMGDAPYLGVLRTLSQDLTMVDGVAGVDLVHSHTWYTNLAGHFAKLVHGVPHVMTSHSLEPMRPWKREQLAGGYELSSFCERTAIEGADAVIAVSAGMRSDILRSYPGVDPDRVVIVHNGVDPDRYRISEDTDAVHANGIDPDRPYAVFVGRITRQKGVVHLLDAAAHLPAGSQLVLCAGAPDTPAIAAEFRERVAALESSPVDVIWIEEMLPREQLVQVLSHARVFVCPSIYEPFGIVNLEAMACGLPVVASAVGGIPEIVIPGETGWLVEFDASDDAIGSPVDPIGFARRFAGRITDLLEDPATATAMGVAGRQRVEDHFSWDAIAASTAELYAGLV